MGRSSIMKAIVTHGLVVGPIALSGTILEAETLPKPAQHESVSQCTEQEREAYAQYLLEAGLNELEAILEDPCSEIYTNAIGYVFRLEE